MSSTTAAGTPTRTLYRSLLRELRLSPATSQSQTAPLPPPRQTVLSPAFRSQALVSYVRDAFRAPAPATPTATMKDLEVYLRSNRLHKALVARYNPLHDQTEAERIRATARRVGLDVPQEPGAASAQGASSSAEGKHRGDKAKGPLPPPELESGLPGGL